jgi:hypothetical protein
MGEVDALMIPVSKRETGRNQTVEQQFHSLENSKKRSLNLRGLQTTLANLIQK